MKCGKGIFLGWYIARFIDKCGTHHEKYFNTGKSTKNSSYDAHLYKLCDKAGIESGIPPKVLGHASIQTTMDPCRRIYESSCKAI